MQLKMIPCPKCGNDFPEKRKELGFHVCVKCSTVEPVVGITTIEGSGDHTYNDLIIMQQSKARAIAEKESLLKGRKVHIELLNFDNDEELSEREIQERVSRIRDEDLDDEEPFIEEEIEGIDY